MTLIEQMKKLTGTKTTREFVDQAVVLLSWAVTKQQQGRVIGAIDTSTGGYQEVLLPALGQLLPPSHEEKSRTRKKEEEASFFCSTEPSTSAVSTS